MSGVESKAETLVLQAPMAAQNELPAVITESYTGSGSLVNVNELTEDQKRHMSAVADKFNIRNTADILNYGAATQRRASAYMDQLLGDLKVGEAGAAGELLNEITAGVDLLNLKRVRDQLAHPPGWLRRLIAYTDYIRNLYENQKTVVQKFDQIERKAQNLVQKMGDDTVKLDRLVDATVTQIGELRVLIATGELILERSIAEYEAERERVLSQIEPDSLELQQLKDFMASIRAFETRLLRIKTAFVEASSTAIQQIRDIQEATTIAIQNVNEAILFDMPSVKRAILKLAALKSIKDANAMAKKYDTMRGDVQSVLADTTAKTHEEMIKSRGDALQRAEDLQKIVSVMIEGARKSQEAADQTLQQQRAAEAVLMETKRSMDEAMAESARNAV